MRRLFFAGLVTLSLLIFVREEAQTQVEDERPNILLIISDDQRFDTMQAMPETQARIFDQGIEYSRAYITTSRCCPSRSSILTGMYAHNHNVRINRDHLRKTTFVQLLHRAGYQTGLVGKYLNSYPEPNDNRPLPEFDRWVAMASGGGSRYFDTRLNIDGEWQEQKGYQTEILRDYALEFIRDAAGHDQPFFLQFSPYAPHLPSTPAPGDEDLFPDLEPYDPPNFNPEDMTGKPTWMQELSLLDEDDLLQIEEARRQHLQSLVSLDEAIAALLTELEAQGELDNTLVIFLSDNGFFWGEHRIKEGKIFVYEESVRVPMGIRYPSAVAEPYIEDQLVANIDLAPTILDAAGIDIPKNMDGMSLLDLNRGDLDWREDLILEGWPVGVAFIGDAPFYLAIHTGRYVYVETEGDTSELYDLSVDPYEINNLVDDPDYADIRNDLQARLEEQTRGVNPPPLISGAAPLRDELYVYTGPFRQKLNNFWYTYRYSKRLWGGVGLVILSIAGLVWRWRRRRRSEKPTPPE